MKKALNIVVTSPINGISRIKLNEPNTYNALSSKTLKLLINIFKSLNNENKTKIVTNISKSIVSFKYIIKIADLYFEDSAKILKNRLLIEYNITNVKIKKMSKNRYRIYKGPFNNLDSIKSEYTDIIKLNFENIEIIKL